MRKASVVRFSVAVGLLTVVAATVFAADANGTWKWKVTGRGGDQEVSAMFKVEGDKLTGTVNAPGRGGGDPTKLEIKNGTFKGDEVSFETVATGGRGEVTTKYTGKVEGDKIKGKIERQAAGGGGGGGGRGGRGGRGGGGSPDWEATRSK